MINAQASSTVDEPPRPVPQTVIPSSPRRCQVDRLVPHPGRDEQPQPRQPGQQLAREGRALPHRDDDVERRPAARPGRPVVGQVIGERDHLAAVAQHRPVATTARARPGSRPAHRDRAWFAWASLQSSRACRASRRSPSPQTPAHRDRLGLCLLLHDPDRHPGGQPAPVTIVTKTTPASTRRRS